METDSEVKTWVSVIMVAPNDAASWEAAEATYRTRPPPWEGRTDTIGCMDVPMTLTRILIGEMSDAQLIELTEVDGTRRVPIVVGVTEAFAIERRIKHIDIPRPMTHELLSATIVALGARLERVVIHDLAEGTFYAMLCLQRGDEEIQVDARPSDAIALAVGGNVPILVSEAIIEEIEREGGMPGFDPPFGGEGDSMDDDDSGWA
jgi:bifunctional DNase/RNase